MRIRKSGYPVFKVGDRQVSQNVVDGPFGSQLKVEEYQETGVPLIRVSNCRSGEVLADDEMVYISEGKHQQLIRSEVLPGDVLLTKAGHILGYSAVFPKALKKGNITSHLAAIRPAKGVVSEFLSTYLGSQIGIAQIYRWGNKATRPELNTDEVRELLVPLPPPRVQQSLVDESKAAHAARKQKLAQAEALLAGLDAYLLEQLDLKPPQRDGRRVFAVSLTDLQKTERLNADYFHPERILAIRAMEANRAKIRIERLVDIADFIRDAVPADTSANYLGLANVQSNTGELVESSEEPAGGLSFRFMAEDVLFARLRPYLNKVHRTERDGVCSTEFHVIRIRSSARPEDEIRPDYLATVLRSALVLAQTRHMMTGNTHPRLANEDVVNLVVPIPKPRVQATIAEEVERRRGAARRLRTAALAEWAAAKARFEQQLLGDGKQ